MVKRIGEVITREVIDRDWKMGMKILIKSQTGSGKSWFAQNIIYEYCKDNGYKCLFFSNRTLLRGQNEIALDGKDDVFTVLNYQNVSEKIHGGIPLSDIYEGYDVVLMDEAHFFIEDAPFNRKTDLLLKSLKFVYPDKLLLLMTATPQMLFEYKREDRYDIVYSLPEDYSYIKDVLFYKKGESVIRILKEASQSNKAIYFSNSAREAYETMKVFQERASFICSPDKDWFGKFSDKKTLEEIVKYSMFSTDILCTTKLLDTGVNLEDEAIKTIIIDSTNPVNIIQSIGRKRVLSEEDRIMVYVKNVHGGDVYQGITKCSKILWWAKELEHLGRDEFQIRYRKTNYPSIVDNDFTVNVAIKTYYEYMLKFYKTLRKSENKFAKTIRNYFGKSENEDFSAELEIQKPDLLRVLEQIKETKFFKEEQDRVSEKIFNVILSSGASNDKYVGLNSIVKILKKTKVPFIINNIQETKGKRRRETYWIIRKTESEEK